MLSGKKFGLKKIQIIFDFIESRSSYGGVPYLFNYKSYSYACVQLHAQHALTIFSNQLYIYNAIIFHENEGFFSFADELVQYVALSVTLLVCFNIL